MELIKADIELINDMMAHLDNIAATPNVFSVEIRFQAEGGNWITVGYGEQAEPAVIKIEEDVELPKVRPGQVPCTPGDFNPAPSYPYIVWTSDKTTPVTETYFDYDGVHVKGSLYRDEYDGRML